MLVADDWLQKPPRRVLKLCDFGFAEQLPFDSNNVQHCKGTPPYMGEAKCCWDRPPSIVLSTGTHSRCFCA